MITLLKIIWWLLTNRCLECGGELAVYSVKVAVCTNCGAKN